MSNNVYLSPAKLLLLVAIEQYSLHYSWGPAALSDIADMLVTYLSEPERQADVAQLSKDLSTVTVPSDSQQLRSQPLLSILHYRISELSELDAFTQFFDDLRVLVINAETQEEKDEDVILLDSESIFGIFVRRCVLAFEQLEFHQTGTFHRTCMAAIESSEQAAGMSSALELQDLVAHQTRLLEGETGIVVPHDMKQQIRNLLGALPGYANTHYLDYLRLAHAGEYEQSEASLRRFFDSSAMEQHKHGFQYALLYLAVVRTRLGLVGEAQQALNEAMQIARDFQDHTCRIYVTCWQTRLRYIQFKSGQLEPAAVRAALDGLIATATKMQLQEMRVTAQLNLVELLVDMGDAAGAFRELMLSWTLMAENNIAETRASWFLLAARVWALKQYPTITSMYLSLVMRDAHTMAEAQLAECRKLERHIELQLKGDAKACFKSKQLAEAQRLIDAGRINEANEKLMELTTGSELESRQQAARMLEEISDM